jgi:hypothetical protein
MSDKFREFINRNFTKKITFKKTSFFKLVFSKEIYPKSIKYSQTSSRLSLPQILILLDKTNGLISKFKVLKMRALLLNFNSKEFQLNLKKRT